MGKQFFYCKVHDIPSNVLYITAISVSFIGWMAPVPVIALTLCCLILTFQKYRSGEKLELNKTAACMLAFSLLYTPCVAAIAAIRREMGGKWALGVILWQCAVAWIVALIIRLIGMLF